MRKISHYFDLSSMQNSRTNGKGTEPITFSSMELLELYHSCFSCKLKINLLLERKKRVSRQRKRNLGRGSSIMPRGKFSRGLEINFVLKKNLKVNQKLAKARKYQNANAVVTGSLMDLSRRSAEHVLLLMPLLQKAEGSQSHL